MLQDHGARAPLVSSTCRTLPYLAVPCYCNRLANGAILMVWRDDPGYNTTLMAQVSEDDGLTWSLATPMHGKITNGDYEMIVDAPFGVEPKMVLLDSGVLVLSTGRPRIYMWSVSLPAPLPVRPTRAPTTRPPTRASTCGPCPYRTVPARFWRVAGRSWIRVSLPVRKQSPVGRACVCGQAHKR